jgi:hypothetical protein
MKQGILTSLEVSLVLVILSEIIEVSFLGDRDLLGIVWIIGVLFTHFAVSHMTRRGRREIRAQLKKQ